MEDFNRKSHSKKSTEKRHLYHAMSAPPQGDALMPVNEREVNGKRAKYLFATPYISKSLQHAFSWRDGEAIVGGPIEDTPEQFIIICEKSKSLSRDIHLTIYEFDGSQFGFKKTKCGQAYIKPVKDTREYHSTAPVPFSDMKVAHEISSLETLMKMGLQIFATEATREELLQQDFFGEEFHNASSEKWLAGLLKSGEFTWENQDREINMNKTLASRMFPSIKNQRKQSISV